MNGFRTAELEKLLKNKNNFFDYSLIEEVLKFLFDRLLYEYMEDQSYYTEESYNRFKNTFIYMQLQMQDLWAR